MKSKEEALNYFDNNCYDYSEGVPAMPPNKDRIFLETLLDIRDVLADVRDNFDTLLARTYLNKRSQK
mgnify:CR=1 FL=1